VVEGRIDTGYLDRHLDEFLDPEQETNADPAPLFAAATAWLLHEEAAARDAARTSGDPHSPWASADAWRLGHPGKRVVVINHTPVDAHGSAGRYEIVAGEHHCLIDGATLRNGMLSVRFDGVARRFSAWLHDGRITVHDGERRREFEHTPPFAFEAAQSAGSDQIRAPMPGRIVLVKAKAGDNVDAGQELLVMEAMKMEITLKASHAAAIESVHASAGDFVEADAVLVKFATESA
jgi:3-methylcrotonyl-CoA carboxylase alpha subunit